MFLRLSLLALAVAAAVALTTPAADPPPADPSQLEEVQDLVLFLDDRPVVVRLHLYLDGEPHARKWENFIKKLFAFLDRDGDGELDRSEARNIPDPSHLSQLLQGQPQFNAPVVLTPNLADLDTNKDGKISEAEFLSFYRKSQAGPVMMVEQMGSGPANNQLTDKLFQVMDPEKTGRLMKARVEKLHTTLMRFDENDDELVTTQELVGQAATAAPNLTPRRGIQDIWMVDKEDAPKELAVRLKLAKTVLARYDKNGDNKLSPQEVKIAPELFERLDSTRDGQLEATELLRWLIALPDAEVGLYVGSLPDKTAPAQMRVAANRPAHIPHLAERGSDRAVRVTWGTRQFNVVRGDGAAASNAEVVKAGLKQVFDSVDTEKKGVVVLSKLKDGQAAQLNLIARFADRNGDGKLTEKEVEAYGDLLAMAPGTQVYLTVVPDGQALFQLLDVNQDGRLSAKEMLTAWQALAPYDKENKGYVERSALPVQSQIIAAQGFLYSNVAQPGQPGQRSKSEARGPVWFRKMDVNGDGYLTPREFLGSREDFDKIDLDGDGFISADEAEKWDEKFRKDRGK